MLKLLYVYGQMHTSDIADRLKLNYKSTLRHLNLLEKETVVKHSLYGRIKFFRFTNTEKAQATLKLLEEWNDN